MSAEDVYTVSMGQLLQEGATIDHEALDPDFDTSGRYIYDVAKQRGVGVPVDAPLESALVVGSMTTEVDHVSTHEDDETRYFHKPVIDLDIPVRYFSSSTPGHGHLYIDKRMSFRDMVKLLDVMVEVGLVERGFVESTKARGEAYVRLPWVRKDTGVIDDGGWG